MLESHSYDSVLVVSFGGPEGTADVIPFLENVLRGRNLPKERIDEVAQHYEMFGGVSPINGQNRALVAALQRELDRHGPKLPVYWGNRNWRPMLADTIRRMAEDGRKQALAFVTSAYSSYSGCRQYLDDIERARNVAGPLSPKIDKLRVFYNHPVFIELNTESIKHAMETIPASRRGSAQIAFTAHSIPESMAASCDYESQLLETCRLVAAGFPDTRWGLVFQSRSGPPTQRWLEPDICDYLIQLKESGATDLIVAPVGFITDHMEVVFDLDTQAQQLCNKIELNMVRAATVGLHPSFVRMVRELVLERIDGKSTARSLGDQGAGHDTCRPDCCLPGAKPLTSSFAGPRS